MIVLENNDVIKQQCTKCKSILGIEWGDIHYNEMAHHGSPFTSNCCQCGTTIYISSERVPKYWYSRLGVE